jgi:hypothetical protein
LNPLFLVLQKQIKRALSSFTPPFYQDLHHIHLLSF